MSAYINCPKCGNDYLDVDTLCCSCGYGKESTFAIDEIKVYLESQLELIDDLSNRRLELAIREIDDTTYGIAAVTARHRKEQG